MTSDICFREPVSGVNVVNDHERLPEDSARMQGTLSNKKHGSCMWEHNADNAVTNPSNQLLP